MKHGVLRLLCALFMVLAGVAALTAGPRYRVSDETLTFFSDPDRFNRLGQLHRGDEFEAIGTDGTLLIFEYQGRKAYIASYCCKEITEDAPQTAVEAPSTAKASEAVAGEAPEAAGAEVASRPQTRSAGDGFNFDKKDMPKWLASLIALYMMAGVAVGFWVLFGHGSCERFFDNLSGGYVTHCKTITYFRPLVFFLVFGIVGNLSGSLSAALWAAGIYEAILIIARTVHYGSLREAFVEALFLSLRGIGALALFALFIFFFFLASGGSSSGNGGKKGERRAECRDCKYYQWHSRECDLGYPQDGTCRRFS